jgi:hypothetical protein
MGVRQAASTAAILFAGTVITGMILGITGRPLNHILATIHKIAALGAVVFPGIAYFGLLGKSGPGVSPIFLGIAAILVVMALFASGAILSRSGDANTGLRLVHFLSTLLYSAIIAAVIFRLGGHS